MATTPVIPDPETMDLVALRALAEEEALRASTPTTPPEKKVVEPPVTPVVADEDEDDEQPLQPAKTKFSAERSFDLGDGAGSQVFKGKGETREEALEDLANKLTDAQRNATKRIKELKATKTPEPAKDPAKVKEEESLLAAEIVTAPSEVVKKILGIDPSELKEVVAEVKQTRAIKNKRAVADQFVVNHPEFLDNDRNGQRLAKAVSLFGEFNLDNLEKAYQDLTESGLLEVKGEEAGGGQDKNKQGTRIEETANNNPPQRTKRASGLSTHHRTTVQTNTEPTEDDMYTMPIEELRKRANKHLAG